MINGTQTCDCTHEKWMHDTDDRAEQWPCDSCGCFRFIPEEVAAEQMATTLSIEAPNSEAAVEAANEILYSTYDSPFAVQRVPGPTWSGYPLYQVHANEATTYELV